MGSTGHAEADDEDGSSTIGCGGMVEGEDDAHGGEIGRSGIGSAFHQPIVEGCICLGYISVRRGVMSLMVARLSKKSRSCYAELSQLDRADGS